MKDLELMMREVYVPALTKGQGKSGTAHRRSVSKSETADGEEDEKEGSEEKSSEDGKAGEGAEGRDWKGPLARWPRFLLIMVPCLPMSSSSA